MPALVQPNSPAERFGLPWNLAEWSSKEQVLAWTKEEIGTLDWNNSELAQRLQANPSWQPRFFFELLVYSYALGACDAAEVADLCYTDPVAKAAFPGQAPRAKSVTRFRIEHHGLLRWGLEQVFKQAVKARFELGDSLIPAGVKGVLRDSATARLDAARHLDRGLHDE